MAESDIFKNFLHGKGMKFTPERRTILRLVFDTHEHFDAEELHLTALSAGQNVSRATIYRTLELLVASGLLRRYTFEENQARYEHIYGHKHHEHLFCVSCNRIFEFTSEQMDRIVREVCDQFRFTPTTRTFQISGYCLHCRAPKIRNGDKG